MTRIYFDASVIIAAMLSSQGGSCKLLQLVHNRKIVGMTSQTVVNEIIRHADKIKFSKKEIVAFIADRNLIVREEMSPDEIRPFTGEIDEEDAHVIAGALLTKCNFLVSLDRKHIVRNDIRRKFLPLNIVTPKDFFTHWSETIS